MECVEKRIGCCDFRQRNCAMFDGTKGKALRLITFMRGRASKTQMTWEVERVDKEESCLAIHLGKRIK